jgi:hypothetical protein
LLAHNVEEMLAIIGARLSSNELEVSINPLPLLADPKLDEVSARKLEPSAQTPG